jgi:hypothetical protein
MKILVKEIHEQADKTLRNDTKETHQKIREWSDRIKAGKVFGVCNDGTPAMGHLISEIKAQEKEITDLKHKITKLRRENQK